jgi:hypothetical protein
MRRFDYRPAVVRHRYHPTQSHLARRILSPGVVANIERIATIVFAVLLP